MNITIVFASYNGEKRLPRMLDALKNITYPRDQWRVIAVDNNSIDGTRDVLSSYQDTLPLTVLHEARQGKSHALNHGLDYVPQDTDLVILSDDDVIPASDWLDVYAQVAQEHADYDIFGGEIRPAWEKSPPQWLLDWVDIRMVYALNEGAEEGDISPDLVFGPNSAFRAFLFTDKKMRVPTHIGPKTGGAYPMGNDSALSKMLSQKGYKAWHTPEAIVQHMIPAHHMEEQWIVKRAERYGWGMVVLHPEWFEEYRSVSLVWLKKRIKYFIYSLLFYPAHFLPHCHRRYKLLYWYYYQKGVFRGIAGEREAS